MAGHRTKAKQGGTPAPRKRFSLPHVSERLAFSPDGRLLASNAAPYETHVIELASGQAIAGESIGGGGGGGAGVLDAIFGAMKELASLASEAAKKGESFDIMHHEIGGPQLTPAGAALARSIKAPTGIEAFDQAAGLTRKPKFVARRLSPQGDLFVVIDDKTRTISVIESTSHKVVGTPQELASDSLPAREFSPDGRLFAVALDNKHVGVWNPRVLKKPVAILEGHRATVKSVSISRDGSLVATGDESGTVAVWSVATGKAVGWLSGFGVDVMDVAFVDGLTGSEKPSIAVVDGRSFALHAVPTMKPIVRLSATTWRARSLTSVVASPDGKSVAIAAGRNALLFDADALRSARSNVKRDSVKPIAPPTADAERVARQPLVDLMRAPLDAARARIVKEVRGIFDQLPSLTARVHFQAVFGPWYAKNRDGVFWAAEDRKGRCLVAFRLPVASVACVRGWTASRKVAKRMSYEQVIAGEHDATVDFLSDVWREAKAAADRKALGAILTWSGNAMVDLETGQALDPATHRYPGTKRRT